LVQALYTINDKMLHLNVCYCHIRHSLTVLGCRLPVLQVDRHSSLRHIQLASHVPAEHTEALIGRGETCRWMSAAAGASGDRVLANKM